MALSTLDELNFSVIIRVLPLLYSQSSRTSSKKTLRILKS